MGANKTYQQKGNRGRLLVESDEFDAAAYAHVRFFTTLAQRFEGTLEAFPQAWLLAPPIIQRRAVIRRAGAGESILILKSGRVRVIRGTAMFWRTVLLFICRVKPEICSRRRSVMRRNRCASSSKSIRGFIRCTRKMAPGSTKARRGLTGATASCRA